MIKWFGSVSGILGAILLSMNIVGISPYGYILFALSSVLLTYAFIKTKDRAMISQQSIFLAINLNGIYQWLI